MQSTEEIDNKEAVGLCSHTMSGRSDTDLEVLVDSGKASTWPSTYDAVAPTLYYNMPSTNIWIKESDLCSDSGLPMTPWRVNHPYLAQRNSAPRLPSRKIGESQR